jgi:hypothetical protein
VRTVQQHEAEVAPGSKILTRIRGKSRHGQQHRPDPVPVSSIPGKRCNLLGRGRLREPGDLDQVGDVVERERDRRAGGETSPRLPGIGAALAEQIDDEANEHLGTLAVGELLVVELPVASDQAWRIVVRSRLHGAHDGLRSPLHPVGAARCGRLCHATR